MALASWVGVQLYGRYEHHLFELRRESAKARIEREVIATLKHKTETFGSNPFLEMQSIEFDWPDFWDNDQSPKVLIVARVVDPTVPSYKQVQTIQDLINNNISADYRGLKLQFRCSASASPRYRAKRCLRPGGMTFSSNPFSLLTS